MTPRRGLRPARLRGPARELAFGAAALAALSVVGVVGYGAIEGWTPMEGWYMTFITLTTIGFAEVRPLSPAGQVFTIALATVGIGTFATIATRTAQVVVSNPGFASRRMQRRISRLAGHHVVCGYGRLGSRIVRELLEAEREVVVIERSDTAAGELDAAGVPHVVGDAEQEDTLLAAGIERAAGLVLVLPDDAANVFVALTARQIRPERGPGGLFVVARTIERSSAPKLRHAGADTVISPLEIGADRIAQTIVRPRVERFMEQVLGVGGLGMDLEEIEIAAGSPLAGRTLAQADLRRRFDAIVVAVLRGDAWTFNPDGAVPLDAGDTMIVLAASEHVLALRSAARA